MDVQERIATYLDTAELLYWQGDDEIGVSVLTHAQL
jgi:hypothetical protein